MGGGEDSSFPFSNEDEERRKNPPHMETKTAARSVSISTGAAGSPRGGGTVPPLKCVAGPPLKCLSGGGISGPPGGGVSVGGPSGALGGGMAGAQGGGLSEESPPGTQGGGVSGTQGEGPSGAHGGGVSGGGVPGPEAQGVAKPAAEHEEITALRSFLKQLEKALGGSENAAQSAHPASASSSSWTPGRVPGGSSSSSAADGTELVFVQENVAVHPTSATWQHGPIAGSLQLTKQGSGLIMTWVPYPLEDALEEEDIYVQQQGRPMKEVAVADFHSVRRFSPALGYHYLIIALKSGLALPPLYFYSGGVRDFLSALRLYAALSRAKDNKDVYLVNFVKDPLKKSLDQLGLPENVAPRTLGTLRQRDTWHLEGDDADASADVSKPDSGAMRKLAAPTNPDQKQTKPSTQKKTKKPPGPEDLALNVLEKLSFVTKFARDTTSQLMAGLMEDETPVRRTGGEFREPQVSLPGRAVREEVGRWSRGSKGAATGGRSTDSRPEQAEVNAFERQAPLEEDEWMRHLDSEGRVKDPDALKKRIFRGGLDPSLRPEVWKFLLGYYDFSSTWDERAALDDRKAVEYAALRDSWQSISAEEAEQREGFQDQLNAVNKDVTRTDPQLAFYEGDDNPNVALLRSILTTYSFYNPELGYCQGMCDLLSPVLFVVRDEAAAFWCFAALMQRAGPSFHPNQDGMQLQLQALAKLVQVAAPGLHAYLRDEDCLNYFFCFRWIFLSFKREFSFEEVQQLWDVLWSRHLSRHFHLFLCVAVLQRHEPTIREEQMDFETLLKFVNELSGKINLELALADAERLCVKMLRLLAE